MTAAERLNRIFDALIDLEDCRVHNFALNHMSVAKLTYRQLLNVAKQVGCSSVEVRTDLSEPLFGDLSAPEAGQVARAAGVNLIAVAEVSAFNDLSGDKLAEAQKLIQIASECGAQGIALIPRCDGKGIGKAERQANLRAALVELKPLLAEYNVIGFIEPLGFEQASLRSKTEAVEAIEFVDGADHFKLVHDTFHHYLTGSGCIHAQYTGIVHVSGVTDRKVSVNALLDGHRGFVHADDRLNNIEQLKALKEAGYNGPVSMEAFAEEVHVLTDPTTELVRSFDYIASSLEATAA